MRRNPTFVLVAISLLVLDGGTGHGVAAQASDRVPTTLRALQTGDTVRVWAVNPYHRRTLAVIAALERDSLRLGNHPENRLAPRTQTVAIPALSRIDVQRGRTASGWDVSGGVVGLLGGAFIGAFTGMAIECEGSCSDDGGFAGLNGFTMGGFVGALIGGLGGGMLSGRAGPAWHRVSLTP